MENIDLMWAIIGFILTLLVFSYLLGDNFLFRLVTYILVGITAGYAASVTIYQVLWPRLVFPLMHGSTNEQLLTLVPLVLSALLIAKLSPRLGRLGNVPMGYLVGLGAAVAAGGAILGTLFGQSAWVIRAFDLEEAVSMGVSPMSRLMTALVGFIGTVTTLLYFQFSSLSKNNKTGKRVAWLEVLAAIGKIFIAVTLGAIFAGVLSASITALIDRVIFIRDFIQLFL